MTLANHLTFARIYLLLPFLFLLQADVPYHNILTALAYLLIVSTDLLDGYIARKRNQVSLFGKVMDPVADKIFVISVLLFLVDKGISPWLIVVILIREFLVMGLRIVAIHKGVYITPSFFSKSKTFLLNTAVFMVLLDLGILFPLGKVYFLGLTNSLLVLS